LVESGTGNPVNKAEASGAAQLSMMGLRSMLMPQYMTPSYLRQQLSSSSSSCSRANSRDKENRGGDKVAREKRNGEAEANGGAEARLKS
jgi:hypothetical protein